MVVNTGPTAPNFAGLTNPQIGPSNKPIIKSHNTSGIFVRANRVANQCDKKMVQPTKTMVRAVGIQGVGE
jgi:hypothetical protein